MRIPKIPVLMAVVVWSMLGLLLLGCKPGVVAEKAATVIVDGNASALCSAFGGAYTPGNCQLPNIVLARQPKPPAPKAVRKALHYPKAVDCYAPLPQPPSDCGVPTISGDGYIRTDSHGRVLMSVNNAEEVPAPSECKVVDGKGVVCPDSWQWWNKDCPAGTVRDVRAGFSVGCKPEQGIRITPGGPCVAVVAADTAEWHDGPPSEAQEAEWRKEEKEFAKAEYCDLPIPLSSEDRGKKYHEDRTGPRNAHWPPQTPLPEPTVWPTVLSAQGVLTQKQRDAFPGNAWINPCSPDNRDDWCYTPDLDVPPIEEEYGNPGYEICWGGNEGCTFMEGPYLLPPDTPLHRRTRLTCADKTRFLMTSEDGADHCIAYKPSAGGTQ